MARAQGARAQMALAYESVYGTAPGAGYFQMPFASSTLSAEQPLIQSELLGYGRDPLAPIKDAEVSDGAVVVPIDLRAFGHWLKGTFGSPTSTGTVAATGSITFSAQPVANSTLTINGTVFTFVASGATGNQVNIGANLAATMTALAAALNASVVAGVALVTYAATATSVTMVHDAPGAVGNTFTLAASTSPVSNGTVSGPTLTGGVSSHSFLSGSWTLPSLAIEVGNPDVPSFRMYTGIRVDQLRLTQARAGQLQATVELIAQKEARATATAAGTPAAIALQRFGHFNGSISRNGSLLTNIESAEVTYSNQLDRIETIRADGALDGVDPSMAMCSGSITARFADTTLLDQAISGASCDLSFGWSLGAGQSLTLVAHEVFLPRPRIEVPGPGGIRVTFEFQCARDPGTGNMLTATLINDVVTY